MYKVLWIAKRPPAIDRDMFWQNLASIHSTATSKLTSSFELHSSRGCKHQGKEARRACLQLTEMNEVSGCKPLDATKLIITHHHIAPSAAMLEHLMGMQWWCWKRIGLASNASMKLAQLTLSLQESKGS